MNIKELHATFGGLERRTLRPGPGLTVIQAPNEGGKSTWCAFLRAMFYGIPTRERDKQGTIAEKNRYQPWSGAAMEGEMRLTWQGRDILLRRGPRGSAPFGLFQAVDAATGAPIPQLTGSGEDLTGVSRAVYERSAFIGQGRTAVDAAPDLEARIAALVSTGEEEVSYSQVERQLKAWQNRRKYRQTGLIPTLEEEERQLCALLAQQEAAGERMRRAADAAADLRREQGLLQREEAAYRLRADSRRRQVWEEAQAEQTAAERDFQRIRQALFQGGPTPERETVRDLQEELAAVRSLTQEGRHTDALRATCVEQARQAHHRLDQERFFTGMDPDEARYTARRDAAQAAPRQTRAVALPLALLILAAVCAVGGGVWSPWLFLPGVLLAGGGVLLLWRTLRENRSRLRRQRELLRRYGVDRGEEILRLAEDYAARWEEAAKADETMERTITRVDVIRRERDSRWINLLSTVRAFAPGAKDPVTVSAALSRALFLREKYQQAAQRLESARKLAQTLPPPEEPEEDGGFQPRYDLEETRARLSRTAAALTQAQREEAQAGGELAALGSPAETQARLEELRAQLQSRRAEYDALGLALDGLKEAYDALQARFSPALNRRAGALLAQLTGGKYDSVTVARDFSAQVRAEGEILPHAAAALSQGTVDQLYLAVRLAVCELALPAGDPVPLVLDDALANFDDHRARLALDCLLQLAGERQILLFTCHSREAHYLAGRPDVTICTLSDETN